MRRNVQKENNRKAQTKYSHLFAAFYKHLIVPLTKIKIQRSLFCNAQ